MTVWAPAEVDVKTIGSILVTADPAPQGVDVLVVVHARKMRRTNHYLPVSVLVTWPVVPLPIASSMPAWVRSTRVPELFNLTLNVL